MKQIIENKPISLPIELKKCGYLLKQIHRSQHAAVYSVTDIATGVQHGFEVFSIRVQQERTMPNGIHFAHKERYPSNEDFGVWAFAPKTRERAKDIFFEMEIAALNKLAGVRSV